MNEEKKLEKKLHEKAPSRDKDLKKAKPVIMNSKMKKPKERKGKANEKVKPPMDKKFKRKI
jgi:hypothetical protein